MKLQNSALWPLMRFAINYGSPIVALLVQGHRQNCGVCSVVTKMQRKFTIP